MKLYVWSPACSDYSDGAMMAIATSAEHARQILREKCPYVPEGDLARDPEVFDMSEPMAWIVWGGG